MGKGKANTKPAASPKDKAKADQAKSSAAPKARKDELTTVLEKGAATAATTHVAAVNAATQEDTVQNAPNEVPADAGRLPAGHTHHIKVPAVVRQKVEHFANIDTVPFYRPTIFNSEQLREQCKRGVAIRCRSNFESLHAALLNERSYVRMVANACKVVVFTYQFARFPLIFLADWDPGYKQTPIPATVDRHVFAHHEGTLIKANKRQGDGRIHMYVQATNSQMAKIATHFESAKVQHPAVQEKIDTQPGGILATAFSERSRQLQSRRPKLPRWLLSTHTSSRRTTATSMASSLPLSRSTRTST